MTEYTVGMATGVPVTFLSVGETNSDGDLSGFLDTVNYVLAQSAPPYTMSTSYGFNEAELSVSLAK
jgi:tripeptidyl-peptidase-1